MLLTLQPTKARANSGKLKSDDPLTQMLRDMQTTSQDAQAAGGGVGGDGGAAGELNLIASADAAAISDLELSTVSEGGAGLDTEGADMSQTGQIRRRRMSTEAIDTGGVGAYLEQMRSELGEEDYAADSALYIVVAKFAFTSEMAQEGELVFERGTELEVSTTRCHVSLSCVTATRHTHRAP